MIQCTTQLDAVNTLLSTIGETPVTSLTGQNPSEVAVALNTLNEITRTVQNEGWFFNTEEDYPLAPDSGGYINTPANVLSVVVPANSGPGWLFQISLRGSKLYNLTEHTYIFTDAVKAKIIFALEWDELPETARTYITIRSGRVFQERVVGSQTLTQFTESDEARARSALINDDARARGASMLTNSGVTLRRGV